jgi:glycosyltransferase involved in cell wall biosynthesis
MCAENPANDSRSRPAASVVIPTWNGERFLGETLASVFAQTFGDYEVVVVDDGSTDGTRSVLEPHLDRIRYCFQANAGQSSARNRGAELARGELLAFLDHDDLWEPTYLEETVACLRAHPRAGLVATGFRFLDPMSRPLARVRLKRSPGTRYTPRSRREGDVGTIHNPVVRRDVFLASGGYDTTICGPEDCDLWLRLSFVTEMRHLPRPLLLYRTHEKNYSKHRLENAREWLRVLDKFERSHPAFAREHARLLRRNRAKQQRRVGRELLAREGGGRRSRLEARRALWRSLRHDPARPRTYFYAALTFVPGIGRLFARWRRRELRLRERSFASPLLARWARHRPGRHAWERQKKN